jgi:hypothetical protein
MAFPTAVQPEDETPLRHVRLVWFRSLDRLALRSHTVRNGRDRRHKGPHPDRIVRVPTPYLFSAAASV